MNLQSLVLNVVFNFGVRGFLVIPMTNWDMRVTWGPNFMSGVADCSRVQILLSLGLTCSEKAVKDWISKSFGSF